MLLFALHGSDPERASWNAAAVLVEEHARDADFPTDKTTLLKCVKQFTSVLHFWGAFWVRGHGVVVDKDDPGASLNDWRRFLTEAEILRQWGQGTYAPRKPKKPFLPEKMWALPPELLLLGSGDWAEEVRLHALSLDDAFLATRKMPGRPRVV
jgi:hypothetical protein